MNPKRRRLHNLRAVIGGPIEQAIQANIALVIAQAAIIRLSIELQDTSNDRPDVFANLTFLLVCIIAAGITLVLYRLIRSMRNRTIRITTALLSLAIQATAFQLLFSLLG